MNGLQTIKSLFTPDRIVLYECRRCGTTVDSESDHCPCCELDSITQYVIR